MQRQQGVALIQVLLVFALLMAIATQIAFRQGVAIATASYTTEYAQGQSWVQSTESLAKADLAIDFSSPLDPDYWGTWSPEYALDPELDIGTAQFRLLSLQGKFNLNWLHPDANRPEAQEQLQRLLAAEGYEQAWANRIADWFSSVSGAEFEYRLVRPGYRPSFLPLADASELRLLAPQSGALEPLDLGDWGAILPTWSKLDVTSASESAIRALHPDLGTEHWQALQSAIDNGLSSVDDWLGMEEMEPLLGQLKTEWFTHEGEFYRMEARVRYQERLLYLTSWIHRGPDGIMTVYQRSRLPLNVELDAAE
ncbi:type II secretion system minor pseudopilin GspK [Salinispirillum sp. LH 10-3-1]|uniref:Type II secretion system protein K n=1 Tax=Salinispirillum sp. LH 10-3-1 TaxID=2952525 RepID=A0AB38YBE3_9GAMM